ncbi:MAG TPA: beta-propeller fold lactonase family protein [Solirubrobacterales bacterium]|jgi:6-phosphogluconolactonase (cycloisomerase 2 family)|nr:beta-propeller fold lactonase family protein [Solirubrobacterales bacterium]
MRFTRPIFGAAASTLAALAVAAPGAFAAPAPETAAPSQGAVFVQTGNLNANTVVAYKRSAKGRLTKAGVYQTGGKGGQLEGSKVDYVASQGSLAMDAETDTLFAVNAGSNTITEFAVDGTKLTREAIVPSGGEFPASVAVSGESLYVLNARGGGSIQGYSLKSGKPKLIKGWNRPLGLDPTATPEFTHTPGQVAFTPDGSKLIVTTKGNTSSIDVFAVKNGAVAKTPVITSLPEAVPFAVDFDGAGNLLVSEAGPNAIASFKIASNGSLTPLAAAVPTGQEATCWITTVGNTAFVSNAGSGTVSAFGVKGSALTPLGNTLTSPGTVDSATVGTYLYVQTGGEGIVDEFSVGSAGKLSPIGKVTVPGAVGGEGIVAS